MVDLRYWCSWTRHLLLVPLLVGVWFGSAVAATPPDEGYLNIPTAEALVDSTKSAAFMTVEIAPDAQFLVTSAAFDFSNGTDDPFIDIWSLAGRSSRYIIYPKITGKYGLPPGRYAMTWQWLRKLDGKSVRAFRGGPKRTADPESPAPSFEVGAGDWVYLGHFKYSYGGTATVTSKSVSAPVDQVAANPDLALKLAESNGVETKSEKPYLTLTVEDRYAEFVAAMAPEVAAKIQKRLLVLSKRQSVTVLDN